MKKMKDFCPVTKAGELIAGKVVASDEQFEGFLNWMGRKANEGLRAKAYAKIDGKGPSVEAKAQLIDVACGDYVGRLLRQANRQSILGLSEEASDEERSEMAQEVSKARSSLKTFCHIIKTELFSGQLRKASMEQAAIDSLLSSFASQDNLCRNAATMLAANARELGERAAQELPGSFRSYLETRERRAEVKSFSAAAPEDDAGLGMFAPLVKFIETALDPSVRMEMLAHLEDYVRSGWYARDHLDAATGPGCEDGAWWGARHDSAESLRDLFSKIANGERVDPSELTHALAERVSELSLSPVIDAAQKARKEGESRVISMEAPQAREVFAKAAGSRRPDTFWISPDSKRAFISCATSDETMSGQGNQMARYLKAIEHDLAGGAYGGSAYLGHHRVPDGVELTVEVRTVSVCYAQERTVRGQGAQAGRSLLSCFAPGAKKQEAALIEAFNAVPFLSKLLEHTPPLQPEELASFHLNLVGARDGVWGPARAKIEAAPDEGKRLAGCEALAMSLAKVAQAIEAAPLRDDVIFNADAGGIGSKAYKGLRSLLSFAGSVAQRRSQASPAEREAMDEHLRPVAGALAASFEKLANVSSVDNYVVRGVVADLAAIAADRKPGAAKVC